MKERLIEFLRNENKSSAQLAEEIGVQASGISHIISGRNNPSLDFVLKMLDKYKFLSTDWLLFGKGTMYKEPRMQNLFDNFQDSAEKPVKDEFKPSEISKGQSAVSDEKIQQTASFRPERPSSGVIKIVWFYDNNSFEEFFPV
jgi:transcriptional regulator with XRE-family HTH domain